MRDLAIDRIEVLTVGPPTERLSWALGMEGQYMTSILLRLTTRGGLIGLANACSYSDRAYDFSVAETLRPMLADLIGRSPLEREAIWRETHSKTLPRAPQAQSLIDVALWDLAAKAAGLPLYQLLGGARGEIAAYASTPLLESAEAYVDCVADLRSQGFKAVKFHCWCEPDLDLAMIEKVDAAFGRTDLAFMLDVEQRYHRDGALRVGRVIGELGYAWFEAPLDDYDLSGYRHLTRALTVPVIPAGNSITDYRLIAFALEQGCWSKVRIDVMVSGGLTGALKIMHLAACHGVDVELQCWGYTLHQAANLHLMLGQPNASYFEQPTQYDVFEYGATGAIRTGPDGMVRAPEGPGLGFDIDRAAVEAALLGRIEVRAG